MKHPILQCGSIFSAEGNLIFSQLEISVRLQRTLGDNGSLYLFVHLPTQVL